MTWTREQIYTAFETSLAALSGITTVSRKLRHWNDVPPEEQPYVGISQAREMVDFADRGGMPATHTFQLELYLYCTAAEGQFPSTILNPLLDAVCNRINARNPVTGKNTLGLPDEVQFCRVQGSIETDEGTLEHQAVAIIPVVVYLVHQ